MCRDPITSPKGGITNGRSDPAGAVPALSFQGALKNERKFRLLPNIIIIGFVPTKL